MTTTELGKFAKFSLSVVVTSPPWYENCYLVTDNQTQQLVIIDPGGDFDLITNAITALGAKPVAIWLTHGHPDHIGAVAQLERHYDIRTFAHSLEKDTIAKAADLARAFTGSAITGPQRLEYFNNSELFFGHGQIKVIFTPGHTPGGVCYDFDDFVITGDTLFRAGVGRTDLPGGSEDTLYRSIGTLLDQVGDQAMLYAGHGPGWSGHEAKRWWKMMA